MKHTFLLKSLCFLIGLSSLPSWAESGRNDYDLDNDGLIEINDLEDLDAIRESYYLTGRDLYGSSKGCGSSYCYGFELSKDLDFDTNADGKMDEFDTYWNNGQGWLPIGDSENYFRGELEGNGFEIRNLMINRSGPVGLFGVASGAQIRHLGITGPLMSISGDGYTGIFAGKARAFLLEGIFATGRVESRSKGGAGGLVGHSENGIEIRNLYSSVDVIGESGSPLTGTLKGNSITLGPILLTGTSAEDTKFAEDFKFHAPVYMAADAIDIPLSNRAFSLAQLRCPNAPDDIQCAPPATLYQFWGSNKDSDDQSYWVFEAGKLPGLVLNGKVYRDDTVTASKRSSSSVQSSSRSASSSSLPKSSSSSSRLSSSSSSKSRAASSSGNTQKGGSLGWGFMALLILMGCRRRFK